MRTLEEIQDEVAKENKFVSWEWPDSDLNKNNYENYPDGMAQARLWPIVFERAISERDKALAELKEIIKEGLPEDCKQSETWGREVKFCSIRQGEGNQCKHCCNY